MEELLQKFKEERNIEGKIYNEPVISSIGISGIKDFNETDFKDPCYKAFVSWLINKYEFKKVITTKVQFSD